MDELTKGDIKDMGTETKKISTLLWDANLIDGDGKLQNHTGRSTGSELLFVL